MDGKLKTNPPALQNREPIWAETFLFPVFYRRVSKGVSVGCLKSEIITWGGKWWWGCWYGGGTYDGWPWGCVRGWFWCWTCGRGWGGGGGDQGPWLDPWFSLTLYIVTELFRLCTFSNFQPLDYSPYIR